MKIFFVCCFCLLALFVLAEFFPRDAEVRPEAVVVVESPSVTPYRAGYERGYASFLRQMGEDVPLPAAVKYTSLDGHDSSEEESRGYVDGYHRAADLMYCPRR